MSRWIASGFAVIASTSAFALSGGPRLRVTLEPDAAGADRNIPGVEVTLKIEAIAVPAGGTVLRLAGVVDNVRTSALDLEGLTVTDSDGPVPIETRDEPQGSKDRRWIAGRSISGTFVVHYRAPISNAPNLLGAAPPLELRTEDGGFSAQGSTFLALPDPSIDARIELKWDLSAAPPNASGLSSFGIGDIGFDQPVKIGRLLHAFYMGGSVGRHPATPSANGFFSAWQGSPPFDAPALLTWTQHLYDYYFDFFRPGTQPYAVFLRRNPINPGGGVEGSNSFIGTFGPTTDTQEFRGTLAHEMIHTFVGGLSENDPDDQWYSEGIAVFYERWLPLRAGAISPSDFLRDLNFTAGRYYTDALNGTPNADIWKHFWENTLIRTLPYDRGSLYLATVDTAVRKFSGGRRSLDDLIKDILARKRRGETVSRRTWTEMLRRNAGPDATAAFERMLAGDVVLPESDAFGPCFRRIRRPLRRYQLGFDSRVLIEPARIIRGLIAGSAAQRAGVRNGDRILKPVPQDGIQGDQTERLTLSLQRGDTTFDVTYLPRGETVPAYQWERLPDVPDSTCVPP